MFAYFRAPLSWTELCRRTIVDTFEDGCPGLAAQLAFYFLLALFPALLFVVSLLAYLPVDAAFHRIVDRMGPFLPNEVIKLIGAEIDKLLGGNQQSLLTFAVAGAIWSSSSAMTAVITTLNRAYDIEEFRPWWKTRLIAIGLSVALAALVVIAFALVVGGSDLAAAVASWLGAGEVFQRVWAVVQWPVAFLFVVFAIDLVYYLAPNADTEWVWITPGSVLATALWLLTSLGFKWYLQVRLEHRGRAGRDRQRHRAPALALPVRLGHSHRRGTQRRNRPGHADARRAAADPGAPEEDRTGRREASELTK